MAIKTLPQAPCQLLDLLLHHKVTKHLIYGSEGALRPSIEGLKQNNISILINHNILLHHVMMIPS